ncbi:hypothetical protein ACFSE1_09860 [Rhizobium helianthi]|uniref:Transposase n=1 Tax=Rhizobium helianthi TaxID=1132695 RepID=A0ABW4M375_9HYPH
MNHDSRDGTIFIGLHKLAQQNGDGLVPELYALLTRRPDELEETDKIVRFPIGRTRLPHTEVPEQTGQIIPLKLCQR